MRYRSITLNENKKYQFSLVKYAEEYQAQLEEIKEMNKELADYVERCPKIYSEQSDHQSYMIFCETDVCIGAINIGTSTDEKNLEIKVQFIEEKFENNESIVAVLEQLLTSLGMYCYNRENMEVHLLNDIDLEAINKYKYKKNRLFENVTTYTISNKHNNRKFPALLNEIADTKQNLLNWNQHWEETWAICNLCDYQPCFDEALMEEYYRKEIPFEEIFYKVSMIRWERIKSHHALRSMKFNRDGQITFKKLNQDTPLTPNSYEFCYYILSDGFKLKRFLTPKKILLQIEESQYYTSIKTPKLFAYFNKEEQEKYVKYYIPKINQSSLVLEIYKNKEDEIERCYVDFRTHGTHGKVNGLYALRIFLKYGVRRYNLCFTSRKGIHSYDFIEELTNKDDDLYYDMYERDFTLDLLERMIAQIIPILNRKALSVNRPPIALELASVIRDYKQESEAAIDFVKQIKGEIPLPHLKKNLDKFIEEYSLGENYTRKRVLNRENQ